MNQYRKEMILGLVGGIIYIAIELLWRGYSHWSMFVLGGLCFVLLGQINEVIPWDMPLWMQVFIGTAIITAMEFIAGCIVNLWLGCRKNEDLVRSESGAWRLPPKRPYSRCLHIGRLRCAASR